MLAITTVSLALIEKSSLKNLFISNSFSAAFIKSLAIDIDNKYPPTWSKVQ
tara:strand:- start:211 stop:363 length:153 start_codon:yes stop_codon:yes gene_type:complete